MNPADTEIQAIVVHAGTGVLTHPWWTQASKTNLTVVIHGDPCVYVYDGKFAVDFCATFTDWDRGLALTALTILDSSEMPPIESKVTGPRDYVGVVRDQFGPWTRAALDVTAPDLPEALEARVVTVDHGKERGALAHWVLSAVPHYITAGYDTVVALLGNGLVAARHHGSNDAIEYKTEKDIMLRAAVCTDTGLVAISNEGLFEINLPHMAPKAEYKVDGKTPSLWHVLGGSEHELARFSFRRWRDHGDSSVDFVADGKQVLKQPPPPSLLTFQRVPVATALQMAYTQAVTGQPVWQQLALHYGVARLPPTDQLVSHLPPLVRYAMDTIAKIPPASLALHIRVALCSPKGREVLHFDWPTTVAELHDAFADMTFVSRGTLTRVDHAALSLCSVVLAVVGDRCTAADLYKSADVIGMALTAMFAEQDELAMPSTWRPDAKTTTVGSEPVCFVFTDSLVRKWLEHSVSSRWKAPLQPGTIKPNQLFEKMPRVLVTLKKTLSATRPQSLADVSINAMLRAVPFCTAERDVLVSLVGETVSTPEVAGAGLRLRPFASRVAPSSRPPASKTKAKSAKPSRKRRRDSDSDDHDSDGSDNEEWCPRKPAKRPRTEQEEKPKRPKLLPGGAAVKSLLSPTATVRARACSMAPVELDVDVPMAQRENDALDLAAYAHVEPRVIRPGSALRLFASKLLVNYMFMNVFKRFADKYPAMNEHLLHSAMISKGLFERCFSIMAYKRDSARATEEEDKEDSPAKRRAARFDLGLLRPEQFVEDLQRAKVAVGGFIEHGYEYDQTQCTPDMFDNGRLPHQWMDDLRARLTTGVAHAEGRQRKSKKDKEAAAASGASAVRTTRDDNPAKAIDSGSVDEWLDFMTRLQPGHVASDIERVPEYRDAAVKMQYAFHWYMQWLVLFSTHGSDERRKRITAACTDLYTVFLSTYATTRFGFSSRSSLKSAARAYFYLYRACSHPLGAPAIATLLQDLPAFMATTYAPLQRQLDAETDKARAAVTSEAARIKATEIATRLTNNIAEACAPSAPISLPPVYALTTKITDKFLMAKPVDDDTYETLARMRNEYEAVATEFGAYAQVAQMVFKTMLIATLAEQWRALPPVADALVLFDVTLRTLHKFPSRCPRWSTAVVETKDEAPHDDSGERVRKAPGGQRRSQGLALRAETKQFAADVAAWNVLMPRFIYEFCLESFNPLLDVPADLVKAQPPAPPLNDQDETAWIPSGVSHVTLSLAVARQMYKDHAGALAVVNGGDQGHPWAFWLLTNAGRATLARKRLVTELIDMIAVEASTDGIAAAKENFATFALSHEALDPMTRRCNGVSQCKTKKERELGYSPRFMEALSQAKVVADLRRDVKLLECHKKTTSDTMTTWRWYEVYLFYMRHYASLVRDRKVGDATMIDLVWHRFVVGNRSEYLRRVADTIIAVDHPLTDNLLDPSRRLGKSAMRRTHEPMGNEKFGSSVERKRRSGGSSSGSGGSGTSMPPGPVLSSLATAAPVSTPAQAFVPMPAPAPMMPVLPLLPPTQYYLPTFDMMEPLPFAAPVPMDTTEDNDNGGGGEHQGLFDLGQGSMELPMPGMFGAMPRF